MERFDPRVLLVEDEGTMARTVERKLSSFARVTRVATFDAARAAVYGGGGWCGCIVDLHLGPRGIRDEARPMGAGFVEWLREHGRSDAVVLVLTGDTSVRWVDWAYGLDAMLKHKPIGGDDLMPFVRRMVCSRIDGGTRLEIAVGQWTRAYELNARDERILWLALQGTKRDAMPAILELNPNTLKDHVRALLEKTSAKDLMELCGDVYRAALGLP